MTAQELAELIIGPYGALIVLATIAWHLYRENTALRKDAMDMLKKYQERDEEERRLRVEEERDRDRERRYSERSP